MREYINRFHHPESFTYLHPVMKEQLEETYGVMVFQEDVLKVCHHFAGLDLADGPQLSRSAPDRPAHRVHRIVPMGDHDILVGEMIHAHVRDGQPLLYFASSYRHL